MRSRQILPKISITEGAFLPWHTVKNKTKALYSTWEKAKKGERNFIYLWMALLKLQYPKQSQQTCSAALGHDLTLQSAPKLSQPDISNGKKPRAETERREGVPRICSLFMVQKRIVWPLTPYRLWSLRNSKNLSAQQRHFFEATKTDVLSDDTDKLFAFRLSGVALLSKAACSHLRV